jgi:Fic family protein
LSFAVEAKSLEGVGDTRSQSERQVLSRFGSSLLYAYSTEQAEVIEEALLRLSSLLLARRITRRFGRMSLRGSDEGAVIELPSTHAAEKQLRRICEVLAKPALGSPFLRAVWLLVAMVNAHPFIDGNGRMSRILFNFEMIRFGMPPQAYIPIFAAMSCSGGGFEIRLREAEVLGRWDPIVLYFCQIVEMLVLNEEFLE